jgi:hypothetical protein
LVQVASGFSNPLDVQQPDDNSGRLFVVEQGGHIQIIQSDGTRAAAPFLDVVRIHFWRRNRIARARLSSQLREQRPIIGGHVY